ncbi:hypothetical protein LINPERHAP1_LOCUS18126, partial [Linum perenne]
ESIVPCGVRHLRTWFCSKANHIHSCIVGYKTCSDFISQNWSLSSLSRRVSLLRLKLLIYGNRGRVAVTTDMWTATNKKRGYLVITAHYIDNSWNLRRIL